MYLSKTYIIMIKSSLYRLKKTVWYLHWLRLSSYNKNSMIISHHLMSILLLINQLNSTKLKYFNMAILSFNNYSHLKFSSKMINLYSITYLKNPILISFFSYQSQKDILKIKQSEEKKLKRSLFKISKKITTHLQVYKDLLYFINFFLKNHHKSIHSP